MLDKFAADIILVRPLNRSMPILKKVGALEHPINLVYLATWLREHGHIPEIVDLEVEPLSSIEERLRSAPPYLTGVTAMTPDIPEVKLICRLCHSLGIKTAVGGAHPTVLPVETLQDTGCDYVVIGEGEKPLNNLLINIKEARPVDNIEGIAFCKNGLPVVKKRPPLIDVNELPIPDRKFLKLGLYTGEMTPGILSNKKTAILTSRGCPYNCTFCASKVINQQRVRFRTMEKIFAEIDDIAALGFNHFCVLDDTFGLNAQRVKEFCLYLISKYPQLSWNCQARIGTLNEELLALMKKSNCKKISFGVESGSPKILQSINKKIDLNQVKEDFRLTKKYKILTQAFFMVGFPDETPEDIRATEKLIAEIQLDFLFLSVVIPYPGTAIYDYMLKKGLITHGNWDCFVFFGETVSWHTEYFSREELVRMRKRISRKFYFRLSYIFRKLLSVRSMQQFHYLIRGAITAFKAFLLMKNPFTRTDLDAK